MERIANRFLYPDVGGLDFDKKDPKSRSMTQQSFAKEADINFIMERYEKTGLLVDPSVIATRQPIFGDFSKGDDLLNVQKKIAAVTQQFELLPAHVRSMFNNEVSNMLDYLADSANDKEAISLGLKKAPPVVDAPAGGRAQGSKEPVVVPEPAKPAPLVAEGEIVAVKPLETPKTG